MSDFPIFSHLVGVVDRSWVTMWCSQSPFSLLLFLAIFFVLLCSPQRRHRQIWATTWCFSDAPPWRFPLPLAFPPNIFPKVSTWDPRSRFGKWRSLSNSSTHYSTFTNKYFPVVKSIIVVIPNTCQHSITRNIMTNLTADRHDMTINLKRGSFCGFVRPAERHDCVKRRGASGRKGKTLAILDSTNHIVVFDSLKWRQRVQMTTITLLFSISWN